jgi:hypothetical protein
MSFGSPPTQTIGQTPSMRPPGYGFIQNFLNSLIPMANSTPFPQYGGSLDPGLSPSMQNYLRMAQGYSQMGAPPILQGAQASLSNFMDPSFLSPASQMGQGFPDYFGQDPNQSVFGGGTLGQLAPGGFNVPGYGGAPAMGSAGMGSGQSQPQAPGGDPSGSLMGMLGGKMGGGAQMQPSGGGGPSGQLPLNPGAQGAPPPPQQQPPANPGQLPPGYQIDPRIG